MAPQVPQSAQLAYSLENLLVFEPSRAPLEPSGCEPDHFKALKPDQNGRRGGQIALLDGKKTKSDGTKGHFYLHMSAIGWSDLPPAGPKGALEGPKSFKFLR